MSKVDAQRAMREARYAAGQTAQDGRAAPSAAAPKAAAPVAAPDGPKPVRKRTAAPPSPAKEPAATPAGGLCGHRSIGNKSCSRPAAHPEKNHRYK
jgi:hypothetical protein